MNYNLKDKMIKKILKNKYLQSFLGWLISVYIKICFHTSIWLVKNSNVIDNYLKKNESVIICFWHNRLLMAPFCWTWVGGIKMLISSHSDGRIISQAVSHLGIETISGSSRKQNISSLKEIINQIKIKSTLGITPDGPKGPREEVKDGLLSILKKTNVKILPLSYSAKFKIKLNTWDKFIFATPFNKFVVVWGNPIAYNLNKTPKENKSILEDEMNRITKLADNLSK